MPRRVLWLAAAWLAACSGRCGSDELAVLVELNGEVQRDYAASAGQFATAERGARFGSGDALRTQPTATARLQLASAGAVVVQSDTTIRLWRGGNHGVRLKVHTGDASVVATEAGLEVETELGIAILQAGAQLRVRPTKSGQRYEVTMGRAMLSTLDGKQIELAVGEGIGLENAAAEPSSAPSQAAVLPVEPPSKPEPAREQIALATGTDLALAPGASASIYDPKPPTAVTVDVRAVCPNGGSFAIAGKAPVRVEDRLTVSLGAGTHDYRIACLTPEGKPTQNVVRGSARVIRNPGTALLPRTAPKNLIEVDGRTYTIMFQNLLPVLEVHWPHAPAASRYTLNVQQSGGHELQLALDKPVHVFAAGALPEGQHQLRFVAQRAGEPRSKVTTLDIRFDNASPSASLRAPAVTGFEPGSSVHVAGIALPGAQVSVLGQRLALDGQQRFAGDVTVPPGTSSIAVRIQHPRSGVRYYVRRAKVAP